jgi:inorganic triphosphatase YgiF
MSDRTRSRSSWILILLRLHQAVRTEQAVHQFLQAVGLLDDDLGVFVQLRVGEFALEQLRRAADAAERVLDLVGEVADQLAVGLLLLGQTLLARRFQLLVDVAELEQQADAARFHRSNRAIEVQGLRTMPVRREILSGITPVVGQRIAERGRQARRLAQQLRQGPAQHLAGTDAKQVFRRGIEILDDQAGIQQDHRGRQQVEPGKGGDGEFFRCGHATRLAKSAPWSGRRAYLRLPISFFSASMLRSCSATLSL